MTVVIDNPDAMGFGSQQLFHHILDSARRGYLKHWETVFSFILKPLLGEGQGDEISRGEPETIETIVLKDELSKN